MMAALRSLVARLRARASALPAILLLLALAGGASASGAGAAESATVQARSGPSGDRAAAVGNGLELGFEERVRSENWDNVTDFSRKTDDARHQWRFRTRAWAKLGLGAKAEVMVGLNNETRRITHPVTDFYPDETVFETLYLEYRFADQVSLRAGRQNIVKGDGSLLFDASPLDGSRTQYYNAIDLGYAAGKTRFDLYAISDPYRDRWLPRFDDKNKSLIESNERALVLYVTDASRPKTALDAYYVFKTETGDTRALTNVARLPDRALHTLGGRAACQRFPGWEAKAELAGQLGGQQPSANVLAWGGTATLKRTLERALGKPALLLGWTALSGDDPSTAAYEGWDPLFSRWPKWSDMMVYVLGAERGAAYWTNLSMGQVELQAAPLKSLALRATYYRMAALHRYPGKPAVFGTGLRRGDLFEARADVKASESWRGHVTAEYLKPGDFYVGSDAAWFFRAEVIYSFRKTLAL